MLEKVQEVLTEYKGQEIRVLSLPDFSVAEHMVVVSGTSARHLWTLADKLSRSMCDDGVKGCMEGDAQSDWIVLDLGAIIVHFFTPEKREFYDLENLWGQRVCETDGVRGIHENK